MSCALASCAFTLDNLQLEIKDFSVGALAFSDVSVSLAMPAVGTHQDDTFVIAENEMHLTATFRLTSYGRPMFDGAPVSVSLRNHQAARLHVQADSSLSIEALDVVRWPFKIALVSEVSP